MSVCRKRPKGTAGEHPGLVGLSIIPVIARVVRMGAIMSLTDNENRPQFHIFDPDMRHLKTWDAPGLRQAHSRTPA